MLGSGLGSQRQRQGRCVHGERIPAKGCEDFYAKFIQGVAETAGSVWPGEDAEQDLLKCINT